jgi:GNAT superfamily N-acetyltransferase
MDTHRPTTRILPHRETNAIATLTLAFAADPANRWCWPAPADFLAAFPVFARALGGRAFANESGFEVGEGAGVALWLPPGVEPLHQSRGLGATVLWPILQRCDRERLPAYLESTNPRNIPFYERLGFRQVGIIRAGTSPEIVPMVRDPR